MAGYDNRTTSAWAGVQVYPSARAEVYANLTWNRASASIRDFAYDGGEYAAQLVGLDFALHSATMASYSDLKFSRTGVNGGLSYRIGAPLVLNVGFDLGRYDDAQPFLFDATGRYVQAFAGLTWLF